MPPTDEDGFEKLDWRDVEIIEIVEISASCASATSTLALDFEEDTPVRRPTAYQLRLLRPDETLPP